MQELAKIEPETLTVANVYLQTMDMHATAEELSLPLDTVQSILAKRDVKKYVGDVFLQVGYNNRYKLQAVMDDIIDRKLEELEETELGSTRDIAQLIKMKHDMRMQELKAMQELEEKVVVQNNTQINQQYGNNYSDLMGKLLEVEPEK